ncbi:nuclear transport factor 2 family protein [Myxococcota bacterium]|nr:nuclear transport factor 2 family protein [Myxococcota bacterium]
MIDLQEIEAIKQLKYRYLRAVDMKLWDLLRDTFAEDAVSSYAGGSWSFNGRDEILNFLTDALGELVTLHQCHHPEIELTSPTTAKGIWYLEDYVINPEGDQPAIPARTILRGAAFYHDEYVKVDGEWKIQSTGYERTFEEHQSLDDCPTLELKSRWRGETA